MYSLRATYSRRFHAGLLQRIQPRIVAKTSLAVALLAHALLVAPSAAPASETSDLGEYMLAPSSWGQGYFDLDAGFLACYGSEPYGTRTKETVQYYDLETRELRASHPVPVAGTYQGIAGPPRTSGGRVVWEEARPGGGSSFPYTQLYMWDVVSDSETQLSPAGNISAYDIADGLVAWATQSVPASQVHVLRLADGRHTVFDVPSPGSVCTDGRYVVWSDERRSHGSLDTYAYDSMTEATMTVASNTSPRDVDEGIVVFTKTTTDTSGRSSLNVFGYDLALQSQFTVCDAPSVQSGPRISNDIVLWADSRTGAYTYRMKDLTTGGEHDFGPGWLTGGGVGLGYPNVARNGMAADGLPIFVSNVSDIFPRSSGESGNMSGCVVDFVTGAPVEGIQVTAYRIIESTGAWTPVHTVSTAAGGIYQLFGLTPGEYRIGFADPFGIHAPEYYDGVGSLADATVVNLANGADVPDLNAELMPANLLASGFRTDRDGYSFRNYPGYADEQLFRDVFGLTGPLSPRARTFYGDRFRRDYGKGMCYGMAATAGMFYREAFGGLPSDYDLSAGSVFEIDRVTTRIGEILYPGRDLDEPIERHIAKYFYFQFDPDVVEMDFRAQEAGLAGQRVTDELAAGWTDPYILGMHYRSGGGHAVNVLGLAGNAYNLNFQLYDNNAPGITRWLQATDDGFNSASGYDVTKACLIRTSANEKEHIEPLWEPRGGLNLLTGVTDSSELLVRDAAGLRVGVANGQTIDESPNGRAVIPFTSEDGGDEHPNPMVYLDSTVEGFEIRSTNGDRAGGEQWGERGALRVYASCLPTDAVLSVTSDMLASRAVASADATIPSTALTLSSSSSETDERVFVVDGVRLTPRARLFADVSADNTSIDVAAAGELQVCEIALTDWSTSSEESVTVKGVQIEPETTATVSPWDWNRLATMPIVVTTVGVDGTANVEVYNATEQNLTTMLREMLAAGDIPNKGLMTSILKQIENAPLWALEQHLDSLVTEGKISRQIADLILATAGSSQEVEISPQFAE